MAGAQPICEKTRAAERAGLTGISPTYFVAGSAALWPRQAPDRPPAAGAGARGDRCSRRRKPGRSGRGRARPATDGVLPRLGP